jgi:hypothetical protein
MATGILDTFEIIGRYRSRSSDAIVAVSKPTRVDVSNINSSDNNMSDPAFIIVSTRSCVHCLRLALLLRRMDSSLEQVAGNSVERSNNSPKVVPRGKVVPCQESSLYSRLCRFSDLDLKFVVWTCLQWKLSKTNGNTIPMLAAPFYGNQIHASETGESSQQLLELHLMARNCPLANLLSLGQNVLSTKEYVSLLLHNGLVEAAIDIALQVGVAIVCWDIL